ncbi:MAG TPA: glycosyltransferase family 4 protein [Pirellulaceae bacterium]|nr:glycosyltransferase family 4 protein [Pirellulaceae bacterium]
MRIAHVITRMIVGGAQENTLFTCEDLIRDHGDEVLLITGPALGPEGNLLTGQRGRIVPQSVVPSLRRAIHPVRDLRAYWEIKRQLRDFRPEVVHTHSAKGGILGRTAAAALEVPVIVHTVHGAPFHDFQSRGARSFFRLCEKFAARRCHALISVADAMTEQLVEADVAPRDKFTTIYSGMDVAPLLNADAERLATRRELGFDTDHVVVGKIARLFHLKGHQYLIEAAALAVKDCPRLRFLLIGDGILRAELEAKIAEAGLTAYFRFTGLVDPQRIPTLVGAMDALVHCSLREGLARALPQALIAGRPAISYDIDGAREVIVNGETGYLLPARSVEPLAEALVDVASNDQRRRQMGQIGRERFTEQFRHENMTAQIRLLYQRLVQNR